MLTCMLNPIFAWSDKILCCKNVSNYPGPTVLLSNQLWKATKYCNNSLYKAGDHLREVKNGWIIQKTLQEYLSNTKTVQDKFYCATCNTIKPVLWGHLPHATIFSWRLFRIFLLLQPILGGHLLFTAKFHCCFHWLFKIGMFNHTKIGNSYVAIFYEVKFFLILNGQSEFPLNIIVHDWQL